MADLRKYLYGIIPCPEERAFPATPLGSEAGTVHTVCHQGLAVVVSDSLETHYESTRSNMLAHESVLETVMQEFSLLPVRFGTVTDPTSPVECLHRLLSRRFDEFTKLLKEMEGKVELGLKALWRDEKAIYEGIIAENPDIRRLRNSLSGKPPQAIRFEGIRLGQMVKEALERKRGQEAARILLPLRSLAHSLRENSTPLDRMIVNAAFLVDKSREAEFDGVVRRLDEELGRRVAFKYIGPVPPYNFVNIVVNWQELGKEPQWESRVC